MKIVFSRTVKKFVVLSFIAFSVACGSAGQLVQQSPSDSTGGKSNFFESESVMQSLNADLKKAVGSENPNILEILIYEDYAMIQVQDPKKPENVDGYTYRDGKLSEPQPVKLMGGGELKDNIFPLNSVNLNRIPGLSKEVNEKLKDVESGKLIGYSIGKNLPFSEDVKINILTSAARKSVMADADAQGKLLKFEAK